MLAAGEGRRTGHHTNKVLLPLAGRRVFTWSIRWARLLPSITHTVLVIRDQDRPSVLATVDREVDGPELAVVTGGDSRHSSEWQALQELAPAIDRLDQPLSSARSSASVGTLEGSLSIDSWMRRIRTISEDSSRSTSS